MSKILIKNAKCVDNTIQDIFIENQTITKIPSSINEIEDIQVISLDDDCYVSAGWIDLHTHCFEKFEIYADNCEEIGYKKGVTTVVDAGTAGSDNIEEFYESVKDCRTRVYSFLNISKTGIYAQNELADLKDIDIDAFCDAYRKYNHFIVGVKARMSKSVVGDNGDLPLYKALEIANKTHLPLMVHIGTAPSHIDVVMRELRPYDIVTHIFNPKENGILENEKVKKCVVDAYKNGVYFDLGHGTDSFSFDVLDKATQNDIKVYTISSDIYHRNRKNGPVYDLATTMTKLYHNGYSLKEVIDCVTKHPAKVIHLENQGEIKEGYLGDLTIFKIVHEKKKLQDSTGKIIVVDSYIKPVAVVIKGEYIYLEEDKNNGCLF